MNRATESPTSDAGLVKLRRTLHRHPEPSGAEAQTARRVARRLAAAGVSDVLAGIGGHGLVARIPGSQGGPVLAVRAELDALPIAESPATLAHASTRTGCAHKCGHDGHMTILLGLAEQLLRSPPAGDVFLFFQPAEETGEGAAAMLCDARVRTLPLEAALAIHNLPGYPLGTVVVRNGPFAAASVGLVVDLVGRASHAGQPELGCSPAAAVAALIQWFEALPQRAIPLHSSAKVTVIHARVGEVAFGTSPGQGTVMATLRAEDQETLDVVQEYCRRQLPGLVAGYGLESGLAWREPFPATVNHPVVVDAFRQAARQLGVPVRELPTSLPWSEDFGHFATRLPAALVGLGAGRDHPPLHAPDYDFPDALLLPGVRLLAEAVAKLQAPASPLAGPRETDNA